MAASGIAKRFVPLMDRILVQKLKAEVKTASGLVDTQMSLPER